MKNISYTISITDKISSVIKNITGLFGNLNDEVKGVQSQTQKYVNLCNQLKFPDFNAFLQVFERYGNAFKDFASVGMSFEQSMADLSSITGIVGDELKGLEENSRRFGEESGLGADAAARAYSLLASQIDISKIGIEGLNKLEEKSITLAQASGMSLDGAANALAGTINQFGLGAEEADRVINVLAAGSKYGAAEIEDLTQSFKVVGAAASAMGLDVESTAGALEILSQANLKGSEAGTALRNIILKLNTELGVDLGETSLSTALEALKPKLSDAAYLSKVFCMENIAAAQFLIQNASAVDEMTTQLTGTAVAEEQAAVRTATTAQRMQELRAWVDDLKISLTDAMGEFAPYIVILAEYSDLVALLGSVMKYANNMVVKLTGSTLLQNVATKASTVATKLWEVAQNKASIAALASAAHEKVQAIARNMLAAAGYTAAAGTTALTVATVALYSALTLGLAAAITGIVTLMTSLFSSSTEAAEGIDALAEANDAFNSTVASTKAELDMEIAKLKELINSNGDTAETIDKLNQKYGEAFGFHNTAAEWYDTLITKSKAYCNQLGYEAQAKVLASKIAENELKMQEMESSGTHQEKKMETSYTWARGVQVKKVTVETDEYATIKAENEKLKESFNTCLGKAAEASKELNRTTEENTASVTWQTMSYADLGKAIESQKGKVEKLAGTNNKAAKAEASLLKQMETRYNALGKQYGLNKGNSSNADNDKYNGKNFIADAKSYKELGNNIKYYKNQLEEADSSNTELISNISKQIASLETEQDKVLDLQERASLPIEENSIDNITKKIAYQQKIRKTATIDQIAGIDAEIARLNELLKAFEDSSKPELNIEKINTYEQLDKAISYYESKLKTASAAERAEFQKSINILKNKRDEWDASLETLNVPAEIGSLDTISKLDNAISFYSERMNNASATEIAGIQAIIIQLQAKRDAMQQLADIPTMQSELAGLKGLSGQQLYMKLELIGLDSIKAKIQQLKAMLNNTDNPLTAEQKEEVEGVISQWEQYGNTLENTKNKGDLITGAMGNLSSLMGSLSGVVGEGAGAWLSYGANILSAVAQALPAIASVIGGNIAQAFSGAAAQSQTVPFPYNLIALAASMAAVGAAVASIPKFANGGIAYGPTLGIFGEYAGASTNPEVVAPLNRLKSIIGIDNGFGGGEVRFRIEGRTLVGILSKESARRERVR